MIKRRKIINAYKRQAICDKCGAIMRHTGMVLTSYPPKFPYQCTNSDCDGYEVFDECDCPDRIEYEFEEENNV